MIFPNAKRHCYQHSGSYGSIGEALTLVYFGNDFLTFAGKFTGKEESENDSPNSLALSRRNLGMMVCSSTLHHYLIDLGLLQTLARIIANISS